MEDIFYKINELLRNPKLENIISVFETDGYIRLNRVYISPFSLKQLLVKLMDLHLASWQIGHSGWFFQFRDFRLKFHGSVNIVYKRKIFCMEFDFDPRIDKNIGLPALNELETYLKECDALFFMTYIRGTRKEEGFNKISGDFDLPYEKDPARRG